MVISGIKIPAMVAKLFGEPDQVIGYDYLLRWWVIPRNRFFNIYLHRFGRSDDDRATHDHPWHSLSIRLAGQFHEIKRESCYGAYYSIEHEYPRQLPRIVFRKATDAHRIVLDGDAAWTLFITGPRIRAWGFWCGRRWVPWREFTDHTGAGVGKGCD